MNRHALMVVLLVLSLLGIADSAYLANAALTGATLTCNIAGLSGCNVVAQSVYSHIFGIPLGVYGVVFYVIVFALSALLLIRHSRFAHHAIAVMGWIGVLASIIFICVQFFLIKALCVYCIGSAVLTVLICFVATQVWRRFPPPQAAGARVRVPVQPPVPPTPSA